MRVVSPSGIGDWSWLWSKLYNVRDEIDAWGIVDGFPYRTREYTELCDPGKPVTYDTNISYNQIVQFEMLQEIDYQRDPTWEKIASRGYANLLIEANRHLEHGRPLEEWLPDLPVEYHYPIALTEKQRTAAAMKLARAVAAHPMKDGPLVGISCASYRGSEAWKTWGAEQWIEALKYIMDEGWRPILMGGSWDDLTYSVACQLSLPDLVGKTSVAEMVAILDTLDSYVGFSSGMNVIRTVLDKPALALWPDHQLELSRSWAPPAMLESGRYVAHLWRPVSDMLPVVRRFLMTCAEECDKPAVGNGHYAEEDTNA